MWPAAPAAPAVPLALQCMRTFVNVHTQKCSPTPTPTLCMHQVALSHTHIHTHACARTHGRRLLGSTGSDADSVGVGSSAGSSVGSTVLSGSDASGAVHGAALHTDADGQQHTPAGNGGIKQKEVGQMVLFFGCRRRDQDYLYGKDLDAWAASGAITLFNAFSREQVGMVCARARTSAPMEEARAVVCACVDVHALVG